MRAALNSSFLRKLALPLRSRNPRLYAVLNRLRQSVLTRGSDVDAYQMNAIARFRNLASNRQAQVLEVGSDLEMRVLKLLARSYRKVTGINRAEDFWRGQTSSELPVGEKAALLDADAENMPFDDSSFDYIFSVATFEHILDLPKALDEMYRVLKPGGILYSNFGPIWSAGKGHHVCVEVDGEEAQHSIPENNPLPDYCHLLLDPEGLRRALTGRTSKKLIDPIVEWVFRGSEINRLFHYQYLEAFQNSRFRIASMTPERDPIQPQLGRILEFRYPRESNFDVTNTESVLIKD